MATQVSNFPFASSVSQFMVALAYYDGFGHAKPLLLCYGMDWAPELALLYELFHRYQGCEILKLKVPRRWEYDDY